MMDCSDFLWPMCAMLSYEELVIKYNKMNFYFITMVLVFHNTFYSVIT